MTKTNAQKIYQTKDVKKLENSEIEFEGEISGEHLKTYRDKAFEEIRKNAELPGFRKGNVPESLLIGKIGELSVLEEGAHLAIREAIPGILTDHEYEYVGHPEIIITKITQGEPLGFKLKIAVIPEVELADYKKIAKDKNSKPIPKEDASNKEVEEAISQILKSVAHNHDHGKDENTTAPELTDELVKNLGDFKDVADFKIKLREIIAKEKEGKARDKRRLEIADKIISESKMSLPNVLIEHELDKMESQFQTDIEKMGMKVEDYLKHIKKSLEDLRKEWRSDAEKRAKLQIVLNRISVTEKIVADKSEVEKEIAHLLEHHKDANPVKAKEYIEMMIVNQKVFEFLEGQK